MQSADDMEMTPCPVAGLALLDTDAFTEGRMPKAFQSPLCLTQSAIPQDFLLAHAQNQARRTNPCLRGGSPGAETLGGTESAAFTAAFKHLLHDELDIKAVHVAVVVHVKPRPSVRHHVAIRRVRADINIVRHTITIAVVVTIVDDAIAGCVTPTHGSRG